ncbi:DUF4209 domain-containing protein (plasmid) [Hymenobacter tibetensis]|uniref:DUF4209 domain-containing protein n=1 Tax=Hymenobacter tibetensis TaxID=497967 RepID=A0ABY4D6F2_9BACT|nr:DUF4209 domain-containing protein [Hymenobacter tibetensis]UOG77622.1 DUF4209 domain-containing protein [Hymenobacter tibetensis]
MPNILEIYLQELAERQADVNEQHDITAHLGELAIQLEAARELEVARMARIEQEVLAASKRLDTGVGYQISQTRTAPDGSTQEVGWPDTSAYASAEYDYLTARFQATGNLYLKSEYGLFLYLRKKAGRPEQVAALVDVLLQLSTHYFQRDVQEPAQHYILHAVQALALAFRLAISRQRDQPVAALLTTLVEAIITQHQAWDPTRRPTPMLLGTFTSLVAEQLTLFLPNGNLTAFLEKNRQAIEVLGQSYRYGAMELAQATAQLAKLAKLDTRPWQLLVAKQYELLSQEADADGNSAAVTFTQQALRLYQELNDHTAVARLEQQYQEWRTKFGLGQVSTSLPADEQQARLAAIMQHVEEGSENELLDIMTLTPMFPTLAAVRAYEETTHTSFLDALPVTVEDKHGNPVQQFETEEEQQEFRVLQAYGLLGQLATQSLVKLMLEAYKAGKFTAEGVLQHLAQTWVGQPRPIREHGRESQTQPLRLLASGIRMLFAELDRWRAGHTEEPDFIASTDSLVLKVEYLLRYLCELLGIPTFRPKRAGIVHEKLLDELLRDLQEDGRIEAEDLFYIRFYLQEKVGQNLRNRIAHGLMDDSEYGLESAFLVLTMILKLANYELRPSDHA